jgi:hypothetical protein
MTDRCAGHSRCQSTVKKEKKGAQLISQLPISSSVDPATGNLLLNTPGGTVVQNAPTAFQTDNAGTRTAVAVQQVVNADGTLSFQLSGYDPSQPLTIDPVSSSPKFWPRRDEK